ncbi:hypothetical protein pdam_00011739 [Pocillopora damicornis]|uniref:TIR domain-containing protein n=1 Tax=Pocillopora damicornis TaxID=46731 RepID=A0A3M6UDT5_POCDA|nr:hypothetical protein pdam_00011739 [Pocillopora damicornis]
MITVSKRFYRRKSSEKNCLRKNNQYRYRNCPGKVNESTPVPEEQYPSRPFVAIRRYEDTDNWFADITTKLSNMFSYLLVSLKFVSRPMEHISISAGSRITLSSSSGSEEKELNSPGVESYVFIMFNERDCKWMKNKLLHLLEKQHKLKCRVHYRDFYPGRVFYETMSESVYASYKNIVVYSKNFLKSTNCCYELEQAEQRLLSENDNSLVIIRIDDADLQELPRTLQNRSVIDYDSNHEKPYWEKKLLQFLKVPVAVRSERKIATVMTGRPAASEAKNALAITRYNRLDSTKSDDTVISSV